MAYKNKTKKEYSAEYRKNSKGKFNTWLTKTYGRMKRDNKDKFGKELPFTKEEFRSWVLERKILFDRLMKEYIESGFNKYKNPSVDRIDDYCGYYFDNMQLLSWEENNQKGRSGVKNKTQCSNMAKSMFSKRVFQFSLNDELINIYPSTREVGRRLGFNNSGVARSCRENKKYKGFYWRYECE